MAAVTDSVSIGQMVPIALLTPSPLNPRKRFDHVDLADLQTNIQKRGEVIVPLIVRTKGAKLEIIDGERRYRAAKGAGNIEQLPVVFRNDLTDGEAIEIQLLSAIQRQELTPLEEAAGYKALIESNPSRYSAAYIADRIGRNERYVFDRMKLLDCIPEVKQLLERERILVGHAELLAKLKPEDQKRAVKVEKERFNRDAGGLWQTTRALGFDDDASVSEKDPYFGLKPVTVAELQAWIADHVRFDVKHMAAAAPLDFGPVGEQVAAAEATPGRGKKVIAITFDHQLSDDAKDAGERTYGQKSWKRADGTKKTQRTFGYPSRLVDSPTCEHSVLGVVVAGDRHYGQAFPVCIAREKCQVHWGKEIAEREKNAKLRAKGQGSKAAQNEATAAAKQKASEDERRRQVEAWKKLEPHIVADAVAQAKAVKTLTPAQATWIFSDGSIDTYSSVTTLKKHLGANWHKNLASALLVLAVTGVYCDSFDEYVNETAKPAGLNLKRLEAIRDKHQPKEQPAKAAKKGKA